MRLDERALLQERVRTLVLRHALEAALERLAASERATGSEAEAGFLSLERAILTAARDVAERAGTQKLAVLVAVEDAGATIRAAFEAAQARRDQVRRDQACAEQTRSDQTGSDAVPAETAREPAALAA